MPEAFNNFISSCNKSSIADYFFKILFNIGNQEMEEEPPYLLQKFCRRKTSGAPYMTASSMTAYIQH